MLDGRLGLDVLASRGDQAVVGIGLFGSYLKASGTFPREARAATLSAPALGARVRVTWSSSAMFVWAR